MVPEDLRKTTQTLNEAFRQSMSLYALGTGSSVLWYGLALSDLVLLVEEREVRYATAHFDEPSGSARFLVLTDDILIDARVSNIANDLSDRDVRAVARSGIRTIGVEATETPFSNSPYSDWPGWITVSATYEGLSEPVQFPLERVHASRFSERELLAELRRDLTAG